MSKTQPAKLNKTKQPQQETRSVISISRKTASNFKIQVGEE